MMFEGVSVALVTPFRNGELDEDALRRLIRHVLAQGVDGLVPTGSTGEAAALTGEERERVWRIAVEEAKGRAFVVAGTGTNVTRTSIENTRRAAALGVDGCMLSAPYYNKPTQKGLVAHFGAVAEAVDVPLVVYNVPGRTAVNILPATVIELARQPRIQAVKEASGSLDQATEILAGCDVTVLSGDDSLTLPMVAAGAKGVVSVAGHLVGRELKEMLTLAGAGKPAEAAAIHRRLFPLIKALFLESNPAPVKAALARLGIIRNELRMPLLPVGEGTSEALARVMDALGLAAVGA
jgi:4-hydroxy-tetrahydrodipicolinate synthase